MQVPCLKTLIFFFFGFFIGFWSEGGKVEFAYFLFAHRADLLWEVFAIWRRVLIHVVGAVVIVVAVVWIVIIAPVVGVALRPISSWFGAVSCKVTHFLAVEACPFLHEVCAFLSFENINVHGIGVPFLLVIVLWARVIVLSVLTIIGLDVSSVLEGIGISVNIFLESAESVVRLDCLLVPVFEILGFVSKVDSFSDMVCQRDFEFSNDVGFFF